MAGEVMDGIFGGLRRLVTAERYRVACLFERDPLRSAQLWRRWPELFPALDRIVASLPDPCFLCSIQIDPARVTPDRGGEVTRFRKLKWSEANNRRWVDDLVERSHCDLAMTEFWSPWRQDLQDLQDRRGGPLFYAKVDAASEHGSPEPEYDWQSLTIAVRHDRLADTKALVQDTLDLASQFMDAPRLLVFDRSWGERGKYTRFIRVNGLEDSYPAMLEDWWREHPRAQVARFDA